MEPALRRLLCVPATGSGVYGIHENSSDPTSPYIGAYPGAGCYTQSSVPGSGSYSQALTGPLGGYNNWYTTGGDSAIVAALQNRPLKVLALHGNWMKSHSSAAAQHLTAQTPEWRNPVPSEHPT